MEYKLLKIPLLKPSPKLQQGYDAHMHHHRQKKTAEDPRLTVSQLRHRPCFTSALYHHPHHQRLREANKMSSPHVLEIDPESELKFTLSHNEATPRCMLTLRHPGTTDEHLAFKVGGFVTWTK